METMREALNQADQAIKQAAVSDTSRLDALLLLCHVTNFTKEQYFTYSHRELTSAEQQYFQQLVQKRCDAEPVAYLTGHREFFGLDFIIDERVLIPRADTEIIVEQALELLPAFDSPRVLDMCTGSGCIGITIAKNSSQAQVTLADISSDALEVARLNSERLLGRKLETIQTDLYEALHNHRFHMIIANPPYLNDMWYRMVDDQVKKEPKSALVGGDVDGLATIRTLVSGAIKHLEDGGYLLVECDYRQQSAVATLFETYGFSPIIKANDLADLGRVVIGRFACTKS